MICLRRTSRLARPTSLLRAVARPAQPSSRSIDNTSDDRDPKSFLWLRKHNYRDNLRALEVARFRRPATRDSQYLEIGCGPGNFTAEALLPKLRPCRRLVATDKSDMMVNYASKYFQRPNVVYDIFDADCRSGDPDGARRIVDAYGLFDRVYSFMAFHYVRDLTQAYRNVFSCLKKGGECLTVCFAGAAVTDVWYRLYNTRQWQPFLRNPRLLLSDRFCYSEPIPGTVKKGELQEITAAGMELVSWRMYDSLWTMPDLDSWLECYVPFFGLEDRVPKEKLGAFRADLRSLLLESSTATPVGVGLRHSVIVVQTQKPSRRWH
ncbi:hypothetical protein HPB50_000095 [Hyalomma asiaticum]|uniref:Uncharacterized protein n=1 Tax=Hyalomma asiaticum TaxID=266040 RepID=A0ACB7RW60_HYAAI|nr:hypothetical protein HPB50_000095 [Hyalomma asiaticum]